MLCNIYQHLQLLRLHFNKGVVQTNLVDGLPIYGTVSYHPSVIKNGVNEELISS